MAPELRPDIETLASAIALSPIVVSRAFARKALPAEVLRSQLPEGFDDTDIAVLHWIAEEARRVGRGLAKI
jgi:hypothetical protein